ncbi:hypothetical protein [Streptomyces sp. NPDC057617]|uniref:hypothetical protein n=1 Tax=unclassified Streptomyces TaxID=2593676 RepID=UPI0036AF2960
MSPRPVRSWVRFAETGSPGWPIHQDTSSTSVQGDTPARRHLSLPRHTSGPFETLSVSVSDDRAGQLVLSESVQVHKPVVCNWHANAADVVTPFL